jgi:hypothetical protein
MLALWCWREISRHAYAADAAFSMEELMAAKKKAAKKKTAKKKSKKKK